MKDEITPLAPAHFFRLHVDLQYAEKGSSSLLGKGYYLPLTEILLGDSSFAHVRMGWHPRGIFMQLHVEKPFEEAHYPKFTEGDAMEVFFDTRDLKTAGFPTRFCHHFLILPQEVQGVRALELTRFRNEESHPLCDPERIEVSFRGTSKDYFLDLFFPAEILHGYDPSNFDRLGFTYTVHRPHHPPQNFSASSHYVSLAQNPSLWASCRLHPASGKRRTV